MYGTSSYFWIGGWSFLLLPEWLYWIFRIVGLVVVLGLLRAGIRMVRARSMRSPLTQPAFWVVPLPLVALFIASIAYQAGRSSMRTANPPQSAGIFAASPMR